MPEASEEIEEPVQPSAPASRKRLRPAAIVLAVIVVIGAGVGTAIAVTGSSSGGNSTPATAVSALLSAAQNNDVLGAIDSIAPGERSAIEPGLLTLVNQLKRLDVLSSAANPGNVSGLSLRFSDIKTSTSYLGSDVAAVTITHGTVTSSADLARLPLGSFVKSLAGSALNKSVPSKSQSAATGKSSIVTVSVSGRWYVSLGYTIAVDSLRSSGESATLPASNLAVQPIGKSTPEEAVSALFDSIAALDLRGVIADVSPGEMAALQSYAPRFLVKATSALSKAKAVVKIAFPNLSMSTQSLGSMTLVKVNSVGISLSFRGISVVINGRCTTITFQGRSKRQCSTTSQSQAILNLLPSSLQPLAQRFAHARLDDGFVTVEDGGKWFISPTATILQAINSLLTILQPQDLRAIASYAQDPAQAKRDFRKLEQSLLGSLAAGISA